MSKRDFSPCAPVGLKLPAHDSLPLFCALCWWVRFSSSKCHENIYLHLTGKEPETRRPGGTYRKDDSWHMTEQGWEPHIYPSAHSSLYTELLPHPSSPASTLKCPQASSTAHHRPAWWTACSLCRRRLELCLTINLQGVHTLCQEKICTGGSTYDCSPSTNLWALATGSHAYR